VDRGQSTLNTIFICKREAMYTTYTKVVIMCTEEDKAVTKVGRKILLLQ
jgi:hypothetical protein